MFTADAADLAHEDLVALVDRTFDAYRQGGLRVRVEDLRPRPRGPCSRCSASAGAGRAARGAGPRRGLRLLAAEPELPGARPAARHRAARPGTGRSDGEQVWGEDWAWLADDLEGAVER